MKKILLVLVMCMLLVGCGGKKESKNLNLDDINTKLSETGLFDATEKIDLTYIENKYGLDSTGIEEYSIYMARTSMSASMYAIFKVSDDKAKDRIENTFIVKYVHSWTDIVYEPEEAKLVNDMHSKKYVNYLIYIISKDNDKVLSIIKG